jgi:hypothetical protein
MAGQEEDFPLPDNASKMRRSVENAEHVGMLLDLLDFTLTHFNKDYSLLVLVSTIEMSNAGVVRSTTEVLVLQLWKSLTTKMLFTNTITNIHVSSSLFGVLRNTVRLSTFIRLM